jgi:hypothetical protein
MNQRLKYLALAAAAAACCAQPLVASAKEGDWLWRGGVGVVDPKSDNLTISPGQNLGVAGDLDVDNATSATLEATYMFRDNWGVELLATTPFSHHVDFDDGNGEVLAGKLRQILPTLSLQYHFNPDGTWRPYIGAGINYAMLFDEEGARRFPGSPGQRRQLLRPRRPAGHGRRDHGKLLRQCSGTLHRCRLRPRSGRRGCWHHEHRSDRLPAAGRLPVRASGARSGPGRCGSSAAAPAAAPAPAAG